MDSSLHLVPGRCKAAHCSWGVLEEGRSRMGKSRKEIHRDLRLTCVCVCVCVLCRLHICTFVFQCVVCAIKNLTKVLKNLTKVEEEEEMVQVEEEETVEEMVLEVEVGCVGLVL